MKGLYSRLVSAYAILIGLLLTGLGIILGQFLPLFYPSMVEAEFKSYLFYLFIILLVAFVFSMLIAMRMLLNYAKPIDNITEVAMKIANDETVEWNHIAPLHYNNDALSSAIKQIAENMEEISTIRGVEKDRLKTLIESMGSGLLMFGRGGTVSLVNGMFREAFNFENEDLIGRTVNSIGLPQEMRTLIENIYMTEQPQKTQVCIENEAKITTFSVYGAPVIGNHGNWLGIVVVVHDISELKRLEEVRKDFVANVSHELRTPVTSIKGFAETLLGGAMEDPEVRKNFLEIIYKESNRIHSLIDDLLILSGVERMEFKLDFTDVNLNNVIEDALEIVCGTIREKNMKISYNPLEDFIVEGDRGRLIQVIVNLVSNALAYSQDEKEIKIQIEKIHDQVLIIVEDEGIGIEASELPRLFERFYRVDRARSRDSGGTGLGLAIVKHLVEAHNGTVDVYSKPAVGTAFYIKLPMKQK